MSAPHRLASPRDAIEELARITAVRDLLGEREKQIRGYLQHEADAHAEATQTPANFKVKGTGMAYVTEPELRVAVTDEAAWLTYVNEHHPDRILGRPAIREVAFWHLVSEDPELRERLLDAGVIAIETIIDETLAAEVAEASPTRAPIIDRSGEILPLEYRAASKPTLTVRIDRAMRQRLAEQIRVAGALPDLLPEGGSDGRTG